MNSNLFRAPKSKIFDLSLKAREAQGLEQISGKVIILQLQLMSELNIDLTVCYF